MRNPPSKADLPLTAREICGGELQVLGTLLSAEGLPTEDIHESGRRFFAFSDAGFIDQRLTTLSRSEPVEVRLMLPLYRLECSQKTLCRFRRVGAGDQSRQQKPLTLNVGGALPNMPPDHLQLGFASGHHGTLNRSCDLRNAHPSPR